MQLELNFGSAEEGAKVSSDGARAGRKRPARACAPPLPPLDGSIEVGLSKRTKERIDSKIRELTPRNWGGQIETAITKINAYVTGWMGFFGICTPQVERTLAGLDAHIRRRLRAMQLKQYKRKRTIVRELIRFGINPKRPRGATSTRGASPCGR